MHLKTCFSNLQHLSKDMAIIVIRFSIAKVISVNECYLTISLYEVLIYCGPHI